MNYKAVSDIEGVEHLIKRALKALPKERVTRVPRQILRQALAELDIIQENLLNEPEPPVGPPVIVDPPTRPPTRPPVDPTDPVDPPTRPPVDPPIDPPVIDPPPVGPGMDGAPQRVEPVWPTVIDAFVYSDGTWAIPGGPRTPGMARDAYEAVEVTLQSPRKIVLGIEGNVGPVSMGHAYSKWGDDIFRSPKGWEIDVAFMGQSPSSSVGPVFLGSTAADEGKFDVCKSASFFGIGINGESGTYAFRQHGYCEEFIFDKVWIVPHEVTKSLSVPYISSFNFHKDWERMTLKRYEPRGMQTREHVAYIKGGGFTQVLDSNLFGGRRTGFQDRSHQDGNYPSPPRHGDFIADGNYAEGFGFDHVKASGGQWLTVWSSLEYKVRISNNRCTDARYGCLGISKGVESSEPYLTDDGLSHSNVYIWGNEFENKRAQRSCVSIADARMVHLGEGNSFIGPDNGSHTMVFGSQWGWQNAGAQVPNDWAWYGDAALPTWPVHVYESGTDSFRLLTDVDNAAKLVQPAP